MKEFAIYCKTEAEFQNSRRLLDNAGLKWADGSPLFQERYSMKDLSEGFSDFCLFVYGNRVSFSGLAYFEYHSHTIYDAAYFISNSEELLKTD